MRWLVRTVRGSRGPGWLSTLGVLVALCSLAVAGGVAVAGPAVAGAAVPSSLFPRTNVLLEGDYQNPVVPYQVASIQVTGGGTSSAATFALHDVANDYVGQFSPPTGQALAVGLYTNVARVPTATQPGLDVSGRGHTCSTVTGRFKIDDIEYDAGNAVTALAMRFEAHCDGAESAFFGEIAINATKTFFVSDNLFHDHLDFASQPTGTISPTQLTVLRTIGPDPLRVGTPVITGPDASQFTIVSTDCPGAVLSSYGSCSITVDFRPTGKPGSRLASLKIFDSFQPPGGSGLGVPLTGIVPDATGELTALTPARLLDTRDGTGQGGFPAVLGPSQTRDLQVAGRGGVPASGVSAVVLNVTITNPNIASYLTVWPTGSGRPNVSNLNFVGNQVVANLVTVEVGANGMVSFFNFTGWTDVVADVVGYYSSATGPQGGRFRGQAPQRILDTRTGLGRGGAGTLGPGGVIPLSVAGRGGVPSGATAVVLNLTVSDATLPSFLTAYPGDVARPNTSTLNMVRGSLLSNLVVMRLPANGVVDLFNLAGQVHVVADVMGYFDEYRTTQAGRFIPITPVRLADTRGYGGIKQQHVGVLAVAGYGGIPSGAASVAFNVTADHPTNDGFLTVFPTDSYTIPLASNVNFHANTVVPNAVYSKLSTVTLGSFGPGSIGIYNGIGTTDVIVDAFGYFT